MVLTESVSVANAYTVQIGIKSANSAVKYVPKAIYSVKSSLND